jgi:hypothetical protein
MVKYKVRGFPPTIDIPKLKKIPGTKKSPQRPENHGHNWDYNSSESALVTHFRRPLTPPARLLAPNSTPASTDPTGQL